MSGTTSPKSDSTGLRVGYWIATAVITFVIGGGGVANVMRLPAVVEGIKELGYPEYLVVIIGVAKLLATVVIVSPRLPRLKEWAYAGIVIDLIGASASHFASGHNPVKIGVPLLFTVVALASWALRPSSRRL